MFDWDKIVNLVRDIASGTLNETLSNGAIVTGDTSASSQAAAYSKGWFRPGSSPPNQECRINVMESSNIVISADVTLLQLGYSNEMFLFLFGSTEFTDNIKDNLVLNQKIRIHRRFDNVPKGTYYPVFTLSSNKVKIENIQIELNTVATDYVEHKEQVLPLTLGNIELCKIGDYQDYFYKQSNKWYLHKEINKIVLDGSESGWSITTRSDGTTKFFARTYVNEILTNNTSASNELSNYFTVGNPYISIEDKIWLFKQGNNTTLRIGFKDQETITTVSEFKEWLSTHNTELYYPLATPTDTEITDTTLISQLEAINNALSYEEQTNIRGSSNGSNPIFSVEGYQSTKLLLENFESRLTLVEG